MGRKRNQSKNNKLIWLIGVLVALLAVLLVFAWSLGNNQSDVTNQPEQTEQPTPGTETTIDFSNFGEPDMDDESDQIGETQGSQQNQGQEGQNQGGNKKSEQTPEPPAINTEPVVVATQPPVVIVEQAEADYERWLAASMLIGISMEYPDFEVTGIYLASETTMDNKMSSKGCYIFFYSAGESLAVYSVPLEGERTAAGTKDISSQTLGFATFDMVDPATVNTASMIEVSMDDLGELISQSLLVSIYMH